LFRAQAKAPTFSLDDVVQGAPTLLREPDYRVETPLMGFEITRCMDRHEVESVPHSFRKPPILNRVVGGSESALLFQIHPDVNARLSLSAASSTCHVL
jgi:hypothetical protein